MHSGPQPKNPLHQEGSACQSRFDNATKPATALQKPNSMKNLLALAATAILLTSCATRFDAQAPSQTLAALTQKGVPSTTVSRIQSGRVLDFDDILSLVKAGVSDQAAVAYLKSTRAPYKFTTAQLQQLSDAGAGSTLVNYLGQSIGYYEATKRNQLGGSKWDNSPYFNDPFFWGAAPFDYAFPGEWADPDLVFDTL
jgi:hypothetical protein